MNVLFSLAGPGAFCECALLIGWALGWSKVALLLGEKRKTKIDRKPKGTKDNKGGDTEGKDRQTERLTDRQTDSERDRRGGGETRHKSVFN